MNLDAIRRAFLMTTAEAAKLLAITEKSPEGVAETTWNRWANGVKPVPDDVYRHVSAAMQKRADYLLPLIKQLAEKQAKGQTLIVSWPTQKPKERKLEWYLTRSAHAELIALGAQSETDE